MGARDLVAAWEVQDVAADISTPSPLPDPDEHGMAFALACCGPVEPAKVRALLLEGREDAVTVAEADALHEWLDGLLYARGEPEDDEQLALWCAALEQMA